MDNPQPSMASDIQVCLSIFIELVLKIYVVDTGSLISVGELDDVSKLMECYMNTIVLICIVL